MKNLPKYGLCVTNSVLASTENVAVALSIQLR